MSRTVREPRGWRRSPMRTAGAAWAAALLLVLGCSRNEAPGSAAQAESPRPARTEGEVLPAVEAATAEGIHAAIRSAKGKVVLVNFWATWCVPCVEEFPDIMAVYREFQGDGLRLVLVSGDREEDIPRVRKFLAGRSVDFVSFLKVGSDTVFIEGVDPAWSGAAPATWVYDREGRKRDFWEGKATRERFRSSVAGVINNPS